VPNALVVDAGDALVNDRPPATTTLGKSSIEMLNLMGYDAVTLGGGDLAQLSPDLIAQRAVEARFPILSANAVISATETSTAHEQALVPPYVILEVEGRSVGLIGLTGAVSQETFAVAEPLDAVREMVGELEGEADILILLSNVGLAINQQIAAKVPELGLIVSGGGKGYTAEPLLTEGGPPIVHADTSTPGHAGRRIGIGTWRFDEQSRLVDYDWESLPLTPDILDDPEMVAWLAANH
jgi:2',3'-cyclic-nucleotide 2'-phosphodiesterase (5'-nucleotidase family)